MPLKTILLCEWLQLRVAQWCSSLSIRRFMFSLCLHGCSVFLPQSKNMQRYLQTTSDHLKYGRNLHIFQYCSTVWRGCTVYAEENIQNAILENKIMSLFIK